MSFITNPFLTRNTQPHAAVDAQQTAADPSPKQEEKKPEEKKQADQPKKLESVA